MLTLFQGELKNEISTCKQFQINSTIDFLRVSGSKVFPVGAQTPFQNSSFELPISQYSISDSKNDNNYCHLNSGAPGSL